MLSFYKRFRQTVKSGRQRNQIVQQLTGLQI